MTLFVAPSRRASSAWRRRVLWVQSTTPAEIRSQPGCLWRPQVSPKSPASGSIPRDATTLLGIRAGKANPSTGGLTSSRPCGNVGVMVDVLFVCTGNLCRSPSAALLLRQHLGDEAGAEVTVHSAGTFGADNGPPSRARRGGQTFGIDLGSHVARIVDPGMIETADLVVGLAREHVRETVVAVPSSFPRTFTLGRSYVAGSRWGPVATRMSSEPG